MFVGVGVGVAVGVGVGVKQGNNSNSQTTSKLIVKYKLTCWSANALVSPLQVEVICKILFIGSTL